MRRFLAKHLAATTGTLSCFDRLLFKKHLPLGYPHAMEEFLSHRCILFKDMKGFVLKQAERLKVHSHSVAEEGGAPLRILRVPRAEKISGRGPSPPATGSPRASRACFGMIEPCSSFRLA